MLPDGFFLGKVAIITGGGTGIGFAIASNLAELGARVVLVGRRKEVVDTAVAKINGSGGQALGIQVDVRDPEMIQEMVKVTKDAFGHIDILVNNAAGNFQVSALEMSNNAWRSVVGIVLDGTWYCTQAVGREMVETGGGSILNIGTVGAFHGGPLTVHSASAKAGVLAMTRSLAVEWGVHNIRVNVLTPGATLGTGAVSKLFPTKSSQKKIIEQVPLQRLATRDEIANAAIFILSDYASYITGENIVVDGGRWLGKASSFS